MGDHSRVGDQKPDDYQPQEGTMKFLGREPAQILGLISAAIALFSATVLPLSVEVQGGLMAVVTAILGVLGALAVSGEKAAPLVAGLVQSVISLSLAFGLALPAEVQGSVMAFVAAGVAFYLRTQVVAQVPAVAVDQPAAG